MHTLIKGIYRCVFDTKQLDEPLAVEIPPVGNKRRARMVKFNVDQTLGSAGRLPEYDNRGEDMKILTGTCGHTTQGLRCFFSMGPPVTF